MNSIDKPTLRQQLLPIVNEFVEQYKTGLDKADAKTSRRQLIDSVKGSINYDGRYITVDISLQDYWKYVEYGRRPGNFPPVDKIREWIKVKPVLPQPMANGKLPTEQQLSYLISRSIAEKGIKPRPILQDTLNSFQLEQKVYNQIVSLLQEEINE